MAKDNNSIAEKRMGMSATVVAMKQITEMPKNDNWKHDPKHVLNCKNRILEICAKNGMIPTVNMMSSALGVSKMTEYNVRTGVTAASAEVVDILKEYVNLCENVMLQGTLDGTVNNIGGIFAMKSIYGYRDEPKEVNVNINHNFNGLLGERKDPLAIAERYAEAVVIDVEPSELRYVEQEEENGEDDSV